MLSHVSQNKRKLARHELVYYARLHPQHTQGLSAYMVDVNVRGFLASSEHPFLSGSLHRFRMESAIDMGMDDYVDFNAICLWSKPDQLETEYDAGFKFINLSPDAREIISAHALLH